MPFLASNFNFKAIGESLSNIYSISISRRSIIKHMGNDIHHHHSNRSFEKNSNNGSSTREFSGTRAVEISETCADKYFMMRCGQCATSEDEEIENVYERIPDLPGSEHEAAVPVSIHHKNMFIMKQEHMFK